MTGWIPQTPQSLPLRSVLSVPHHDGGQDHRWLVVFADLLALLIALFVLILSTRTPPVLTPPRNGGAEDAPVLEAIRKPPSLRLSPVTDTDYLGPVLFNALSEAGLSRVVETRLLRNGVLLRARLSAWTRGPAGQEPARDVVAVLERLGNRVDLRIHVPTSLRGSGLSALTREQALVQGRSFARRLQGMGLTRNLTVLLGSTGDGGDWLVDIIVVRHAEV